MCCGTSSPPSGPWPGAPWETPSSGGSTALRWRRLKGREPVAIAIVCALATVLAVPFVPAGVPILAAAAVAALIGWFSHGPRDEGLEPDIDPYTGHHHGPGHGHKQTPSQEPGTAPGDAR